MYVMSDLSFSRQAFCLLPPPGLEEGEDPWAVKVNVPFRMQERDLETLPFLLGKKRSILSHFIAKNNNNHLFSNNNV